MAKPVFTSKWYFCGEHTISKYRGTVHRGYLSGIYSANEILSSVSEDNWDYKGWTMGNDPLFLMNKSENYIPFVNEVLFYPNIYWVKLEIIES